MLYRVAFRRVFSRSGSYEPSYYPSFLLVMIMVATFYAFNTVDVQLPLIRDGAEMPYGYGTAVAASTMPFSVVAGIVMAFLNHSMARMRRAEMRTLHVLGLTRPRIFLMVACEQVSVLLGGFVTGIPVGVLFSHALVFVTAAFLHGTVVGFGFFLSLPAIRTAAIAFAPLSLMTLLSCVLFVPWRTTIDESDRVPGSHGGAGLPLYLALLVGGGILLVSPSLWRDWPCILVVRHPDGWVGTTFHGSVPAFVLLVVGTWGIVRGVGGLLPHLLGSMGRRGSSAMVAFTSTELGELFDTDAPALTFATICLSIVAYQLSGMLGSMGLAEASFDVPATVYLGTYSSFVLLIAAGTTMSAVVGSQVVRSIPEYLILYDLGISHGAIERSQRLRIMGGYALPLTLAIVHVLFYSWRGGFRSDYYGADWSLPWVLLCVVLCFLVLGIYVLTALGSVANATRHEALKSQRHW